MRRWLKIPKWRAGKVLEALVFIGMLVIYGSFVIVNIWMFWFGDIDILIPLKFAFGVGVFLYSCVFFRTIFWGKNAIDKMFGIASVILLSLSFVCYWREIIEFIHYPFMVSYLPMNPLNPSQVKLFALLG